MTIDWFNVTTNDIDEVWQWVQQKYVLIQIVQKFHLIGGGAAITFLLPMMFGWFDATMNDGD